MEQEQPSAKPSFEEALARLETIVRDLEEGALGLSDSLARYEQGVTLLKQCYGLLERAERRIELLTGVDPSGAPATQAYDDAPQSLDEKSKSRSRRRSAAPKSKADAADPPADVDAY